MLGGLLCLIMFNFIWAQTQTQHMEAMFFSTDDDFIYLL